MRCSVNYGDQLERLMKNVLLVTRIAALSKKIAKSRYTKSEARQLQERISSLDSPDVSTSSFSELQFEDFYQSETQDSILNVLEEWDEPELLQERLLQVSKVIRLVFPFIPLFWTAHNFYQI